MRDKFGEKLEVGDEVEHPLYYPTGRVENEEGDVRIACHGYEANSAHKCKKIT